MSELYDEWAHLIKQAEYRARAAGRNDMVDYLSLRASNDLIRQTCMTWLLESFLKVAAEAHLEGAEINISRKDAHSFNAVNGSMVGSLVTIEYGVRQLSIEAGWPRSPRDGFIRGGGLACGNVKHFGQRAADDSLLLVKRKEVDCPEWLVVGKNGERAILLASRIRHHVARLLA